MEDLREKIKKTDALPTLSSIARQLLSLQLDSEEGEKKLLSLIKSDPIISARLIGMANSPVFVMGKKICTVNDAAMVLGLSIVKSVATAIALMEPIKIRESTIFTMSDLWLHSFSIATGMHTLSSMLPIKMRPVEHMLFLSGLLHDLGYLVLAYLEPARFDAFISYVESHPDESTLDIEMSQFGITHTEIGGMLARIWNLPEEVVSVIEGHHNPEIENIPLTLVRIIESITGEGAIRRTSSLEISPDELAAIGLTVENLEEARETLEMQWATSFTPMS